VTRRRWWNLLGWSATALMALTVVAGLAAAGLAAWQHRLARLAGASIGAGFAVTFWHWIRMGAFARAEQSEIDEGRRIGPWGVVGAILTGLLVLGFLGLNVWTTVATDRDRRQAEQVRDAAVREAKSRGLTVEDVRTAVGADAASAWDGSATTSVDALLSVQHGHVEQATADGDHASILIRPDRGGPPCVVVDIVGGDRLRGRLTDDC
jgi:hypothetical protein